LVSLNSFLQAAVSPNPPVLQYDAELQLLRASCPCQDYHMQQRF
jgi:hypothetical protein